MRKPHVALCVVAGSFFIAAGILCNERIAGLLFSPDGYIGTPALRAYILIFDLLCVSIGFLFIRFRRLVCENPVLEKIAQISLLLAAYFIIMLAVTFSIFLLLEYAPSLIKPLHMDRIYYFGVRARYIADEDVVFRTRPFLKIETPEFRGDLYSPEYGDTPPICCRFRYDKNGFRNSNPGKSSDIVIMGDSFIEMGADESDTFGARLERASGLTALNLGLAGYGPGQYLAALEKYGLAQKPRFALFCFFEGNDIRDVREYRNWETGGSYYHLSAKNIFRRYVMACRDTFRFIKDALQGKAIQDQPSLLMELKLGGKVIKTAFGYYSDTRPPEELLRTYEWGELRKILSDFKVRCAAHAIRPVVVFIPTKMHIYGPYSTGNSSAEWLWMKDQQVAARHNRETAMASLCDSIGIQYVSLVPLFEARARRGELLYLPFDSHWNSEGREAAAAFIATELNPLKAMYSAETPET